MICNPKIIFTLKPMEDIQILVLFEPKMICKQFSDSLILLF